MNAMHGVELGSLLRDSRDGVVYVVSDIDSLDDIVSIFPIESSGTLMSRQTGEQIAANFTPLRIPVVVGDRLRCRTTGHASIVENVGNVSLSTRLITGLFCGSLSLCSVRHVHLFYKVIFDPFRPTASGTIVLGDFLEPPKPLHTQYFNTQPHECACGINRKDCSYHG